MFLDFLFRKPFVKSCLVLIPDVGETGHAIYSDEL